jgi:1-acyl-sn-glycerol-3-phosphate acyltransferase
MVRNTLQNICLFPALWTVTRPKVLGRDNLSDIKGPVLFAVNHTSHLDSFTVLRALPSALRTKTAVAAANDYFFNSKPMSILTHILVNGFPFVRRGSPRQSLEYCRGLVDRGWSILVYPEGTRSTTGEIGEFKPGIGLIGTKLGIPIVPIRIRGLANVLPKGSSIPRPNRVEVRMGRPMVFQPDSPCQAATYRVEEAVKQL